MTKTGVTLVVLVASLFFAEGWTTVLDPQHPGRTWHHIQIKEFKAFTQSIGAAHVCTVGFVTVVRKEADGDTHVRLEVNQPKKLPKPTPFVILEIIPEYPMNPPQTGQTIEACGIIRYDGKHKFWELHPLLLWRKLP